MTRDNRAELFELFWENSKLNARTLQRFGERIKRFEAVQRQPLPLEYAGPDHPLALPDDPVFRAMCERRSLRAFSDTALTARQLGSLFAGFASTEQGMRVFASAGGLYPLEVFALLRNVDGELGDKIAYYNADNHSLAVLGDTPGDAELRDLVVLDDLESLPAAVFVFVLRDLGLIAKYGERGGRFALIELGQAVQNLALRVAAEGLAGVALGGFYDDKLPAMFGLDPAAARIGLIYACGLPVKAADSGAPRRITTAIRRLMR